MGFVTIFPGNFDNRTNVNHVFMEFVFTVLKSLFTLSAKKLDLTEIWLILVKILKLKHLDPSQIP